MSDELQKFPWGFNIKSKEEPRTRACGESEYMQ